MRHGGSSRALPAALVVAGMVGLWLATGVEPADVARYLGYELAFVIVPGWLLFAAISPASRSPLTRLAIGWPLGLAAEIAFFSATAALDARDLFYAYPALVGIPAAIVWWRRSADRPEPTQEAAAFTSPQRWAIAGLCLIAFAYLGLTLFAKSPIPGSVSNVFYDPDFTFHISLVAEAKHHWPLQSPQVAGEPLGYHYLAHLHMAASSQVTGIDAPIVYLRLFTLPIVSLVLLQLGLAGRALSGIGWAGPITAGLFLLVWGIDLSVPDLAPFAGLHSVFLQASPSYTFGLTFFIPLTLLVAGCLGSPILSRIGVARSRWLVGLILVLAWGAVGSKVVSLPLILGGLAVYVAYTWWRTRELDRTAVALIAVCMGVFLIGVGFVYGAEGGGLRPGFGRAFEGVPALQLLEQELPDSTPLEVIFWSIGSAVSTLAVFGPPLLGLFWIIRPGHAPIEPAHRFLLAMLVVGFGAYLLLHADISPEAYFAYYAVVAALPVAAEGLCRGLTSWATGRNGPRWPVLAMTGIWLALLLGLAYGGWQLALDGHQLRAFLLIYPALGAGLVAMLVWWYRAPEGRRPAAAALFVLCVTVPAGLDLVLDSAPETVRTLNSGGKLYDSATPGTTRPVYEGAVWIRDNLDEDAVLAVSNQSTEQAERLAPGNADFPAFAERRAFREGWTNTGRSFAIGRDEVAAGESEPFPTRRALEARAFVHGDLAALRTMSSEFGVTHIVVDRKQGRVPPRPYRWGRLVFANRGILLFELGP